MSAPVTADRLKSFLERIERLLEERKSIQSDIKDVFSEAKGVGYDVRTMRRLITIRAQDSADRAEQEALLDTYMVALGMSNGTAREPTEDELEAQASRIVAEVDRCMELVVDGQLPKISAIQAEIGCSLGKASKLRGMVQDRISSFRAFHRENEIPAHDPETGEVTDMGNPMSAPSMDASMETSTLTAPADDLAIPSFLDRRPA